MSIKQIVNDKLLHDALMEEFDLMIESYHKHMEQATASEDLYRSQGAIACLRKLKMLRAKYSNV